MKTLEQTIIDKSSLEASTISIGLQRKLSEVINQIGLDTEFIAFKEVELRGLDGQKFSTSIDYLFQRIEDAARNELTRRISERTMLAITDEFFRNQKEKKS